MLSESERELRTVVQRHGWTLAGIDVFELVPPEASLDPDQDLTLMALGSRFDLSSVQLGRIPASQRRRLGTRDMS
jgi:hypothetical protein